MAEAVQIRGADQLRRFLTDLERNQLPFAEARALTRTAQDTRAHERASMSAVFDRPTPWTLNSLYVQPAKKKALTARIWFKDSLSAPKGSPASAYLPPQIDGGDRGFKRYEQALYMRRFLPAGWQTAPGYDAPLNAYGNITGGQITKMLNALGANVRDESQHSPGGGRVPFFVMYRRGDSFGAPKEPIGVFRRTGKRTLRHFMSFLSDRANYERRFPFYASGTEFARRVFPAHFSDSFADAVATARRR